VSYTVLNPKNMSLTLDLKDLPGFNGKSKSIIANYFIQFENIGKCQNWTEQEMISFFSLKLVGDAQVFYESQLETFKSPNITWKEIKEAFIDYFEDKTSTFFLRSKFYNLKQLENETFTNYGHRLRIAFQKAFRCTIFYSDVNKTASIEALQEDLICDRFISGLLDPEIKKHICYSDKTFTFYQMIKAAQEFEESKILFDLPDIESSAAPTTLSNNCQHLSTNAILKIKKESKFKAKRCFFCKSPGHLKRSCRKLKNYWNT
jgi:Retrotransposon gag protein